MVSFRLTLVLEKDCQILFRHVPQRDWFPAFEWPSHAAFGFYARL